MAWLLVIAGILLTSFSLYRVFSLPNNTVENPDAVEGGKARRAFARALRRFQKKETAGYNNSDNKIINKNLQEKKAILEKTRRENQQLEKILNDNYQRLQRLNLAMSGVINELFTKKDSIRRNIDVLIDGVNNSEVAAEGITEMDEEGTKGDSFEAVLNKVLKNSSESKIPEKYMKLLELYELGMSPEEVAEKMDLGIRETKLVFRLYGSEADDAVR
jgi:hypothetical protein